MICSIHEQFEVIIINFLAPVRFGTGESAPGLHFA